MGGRCDALSLLPVHRPPQSVTVAWLFSTLGVFSNDSEVGLSPNLVMKKLVASTHLRVHTFVYLPVPVQPTDTWPT